MLTRKVTVSRPARMPCDFQIIAGHTAGAVVMTTHVRILMRLNVRTAAHRSSGFAFSRRCSRF